MSDDYDADLDNDNDEPVVTLSAKDAAAQRDLARKGQKFDAVAQERDAAKRELAFLRAGVDLDSPIGKLFAKGYDGEVTADAIKAAAAEIPGLTGNAEPAAEQSAETPPPSDAELAQQQERQQLSQGGANHTAPPLEDPRKLMVDAVTGARERGTNDNDALALGFAELVNAAGNGDMRARVIMPWDRSEA